MEKEQLAHVNKDMTYILQRRLRQRQSDVVDSLMGKILTFIESFTDNSDVCKARKDILRADIFPQFRESIARISDEEATMIVIAQDKGSREAQKRLGYALSIPADNPYEDADLSQ